MQKSDGPAGVEQSRSSSIDSGCDLSVSYIRQRSHGKRGRTGSCDSTTSNDSRFSSMRHNSRVSADFSNVSPNHVRLISCISKMINFNTSCIDLDYHAGSSGYPKTCEVVFWLKMHKIIRDYCCNIQGKLGWPKRIPNIGHKRTFYIIIQPI